MATKKTTKIYLNNCVSNVFATYLISDKLINKKMEKMYYENI